MMQPYHNLIEEILAHGEDTQDRTGVGTRRLFGRQLRFDLREGFPAITTKRLAWRAVVSELIWFLEGSGDERRLCEILHGTRDPEKATIWTDNAQAPYWLDRAQYPGDLGRVYGRQWRDWTNSHGRHFDQVGQLIRGLRENPYDRRHIISAWNPGELDQMALPPCHVLCQFFVSQQGELSCHMYQRSVDVFLGLPFNIASYALLTHILALLCDLEVGELVISTGDTHLYHNSLDAAREQVTRDHFAPPQLVIEPQITSLDNLQVDQFRLDGYQHHPALHVPIAV